MSQKLNKPAARGAPENDQIHKDSLPMDLWKQ